MFDALVLAGGGKESAFAEREGVSNKAFILLNGKPILGYILEALEASSSIGNIFVVGPVRDLSRLHKQPYNFTLVEEAGGLLDNFAEGLKAVDRNKLCFVIAGDIPLINREAIEGFIKKCAPLDADFYYPIIAEECCKSIFPGTKRTYVQLREGRFTGGNVALLNPDWFIRNRKRFEMFISYRKKPLKMLRILPLSMILKYFLKRLAVADAERTLSKILGLRAVAVPCRYVEIGTDVDKVSDLEVVRQVLSRGK